MPKTALLIILNIKQIKHLLQQEEFPPSSFKHQLAQLRIHTKNFSTQQSPSQVSAKINQEQLGSTGTQSY